MKILTTQQQFFDFIENIEKDATVNRDKVITSGGKVTAKWEGKK